MAHDVLQLGVAKFSCTSCWGWLFVTFRRGGQEINVTMKLRNPKIMSFNSLSTLILLYCYVPNFSVCLSVHVSFPASYSIQSILKLLPGPELPVGHTSGT